LEDRDKCLQCSAVIAIMVVATHSPIIIRNRILKIIIHSLVEEAEIIPMVSSTQITHIITIVPLEEVAMSVEMIVERKEPEEAKEKRGPSRDVLTY